MTLEKFIKIIVEMIIYCVNNVFLPIFFWDFVRKSTQSIDSINFS